MVDWMDITGDDLGHASDLGPLDGVSGDQGRIGIDLIQIFDDRQALAKTGLSVDEPRHQALRIDLLERFAQLLPSTQRSEEHTSELQSLMRISYAVFCLKKKKSNNSTTTHTPYANKQNT